MREPKKYPLFGDEGPNGQKIIRVITANEHIPLFAGHYRLVCGIPRKLWSLALPDQAPGMLEAYKYELKERLLQERGFELDDVTMITTRIKPAETLEIQGYFDPDGCYWSAGTRAKVRWPLTGETETVELPDWTFALYGGDKLYRSDELILSLAE